MIFARIRRAASRQFGDDFHRYRAAAIAITVVGITLSLVAFLAVSRQERNVVELEFEQHARNELAAINLAVELGVADIESAGALFDLGREVTKGQFDSFGRRLLRRAPALKAIAWAPRVLDSQREAFEDKARADHPGFMIHERDAAFQVVPAQRRAEYFPVYHSEDRDGVSPFGFDTASVPGRRELLMRSRRTGEADFTGRIRIQTGVFKGQFGVALVRPVYRYGAPIGTAEERERNHVGFATSIFVVWGLINNVLERVSTGSLQVVVYDDSAPPKERFLAVWPEEIQVDPAGSGEAKEQDGLQFKAKINAGSRDWAIVMTPTAGSFSTALSWRPWAVLGAGLLLSLLLMVLLESTRRHAQRMREQAITDPLTGLYNRRYLWEAMKLEFARARRRGTSVSAIMLDIDHFKRINDTFGHEAGDLILRELGSLLKKNIRGTDVACRHGGEEFVLVLPEASIEFVQRKAEAIRTAVKSLQLNYHGRKLGPVTVSLGIAMFPLHADDADTLIGRADEALYEAKRGGRDCVVTSRSRPSIAGAAPGLLPSGTVKP